ncbi:MAG: hypothetical protein IPO08_16780 [Xanthomonadales bacterium]|nr:hypothetical protein [Xanthomonadales bacterium]
MDALLVLPRLTCNSRFWRWFEIDQPELAVTAIDAAQAAINAGDINARGQPDRGARR